MKEAKKQFEIKVYYENDGYFQENRKKKLKF
jgi:hypothetical protein